MDGSEKNISTLIQAKKDSETTLKSLLLELQCEVDETFTPIPLKNFSEGIEVSTLLYRVYVPENEYDSVRKALQEHKWFYGIWSDPKIGPF